MSPGGCDDKRFLPITPEDGGAVLKCLGSPARLSILTMLHESGPLNVNEIAERLGLPQSSTSTHVNALERAGLIETESQKARKGSQKICRAAHDEIAHLRQRQRRRNGRDRGGHAGQALRNERCRRALWSLRQRWHHRSSRQPRHVPFAVLMKAGLLWFTKGKVEYQFPNNARIVGKPVRELELVMELSSEVPGTSDNWPSDIHLSVNHRLVAVWTAPGDYGDQRATHAGLVETRRQSVRAPEVFPDHRRGHLHRRGEGVGRDADRPRARCSPVDSGRGSRCRRVPPSRGHQHFRPWFWQLRPGYPSRLTT
ncbi:MAG: metalloregulator ArsR/SmtB family transcription factor [Paracoccaceae bacterium]